MSTFSVRLLGRFCVQRDRRPLDGLDAHKVQELFSYLILYRDRPHPRETLAGLLWGESTTPQSKKCMRQSLWQLQTALESQTDSRRERVLLVEPDWIQFNTEADLWLDVALFEQAFTLAQGIQGKELDVQCAQILRNCVDLYRGDLLEGRYQDWCLYERERFQNMYLAVLDKLMEYCEAHYEYEAGLGYGARILRHDRARERTHRRLMRLHYLSGDRAAALRQYERCVTALAEELGVKPAARTVAVYDQIRADRVVDTPLVSAQADSAHLPEIAPIPSMLSHLKHLWGALADLERVLHEDMQAIEQILNDQNDRFRPQ